MTVGVIDYGVGNTGSVLGALGRLDASAALISDPDRLADQSKIILPGVGNFAECMGILTANGWTEAIRSVVLDGSTPILGICLGMQLLASRSSEGAPHSHGSGAEAEGLDLIPGNVRHLRALGCQSRVPHIGWNAVDRISNNSDLMNGIPSGTDFYFVHGYGFVPDDERHVVGTVTYDVPITATVQNGHIWGAQFHPEKSSKAGARLLRNFLDFTPC